MPEGATLPVLHDYNLNERQTLFVRAIVNGDSVTAASRIAGYDNSVGWRLSRLPRVMAAVEAELRRYLVNEAAPLAVKTLVKLMREGSERIQVDASKILLDRAGYVPPAAKSADGAAAKQLTEMTADELRALIDRSEREIETVESILATRAKPVNGTDSAPIEGEEGGKGLSFLD